MPGAALFYKKRERFFPMYLILSLFASMERVSMVDLYIRPINVGTLLGYIFVFFFVA